MRKEDVEVSWVSAVPIATGTDGICSVDIVIIAARAPGICNIRENTRVICPDSALSYSPDQQSILLESLSRINAKHFIVTDRAKEYLSALNANDPVYTDALVKRTNLFCVDLEKKIEFEAISSDCKIDIIRPEDKAQCIEVSKFQQDILPWFRKLSDEENIKKTKERYDLEAFSNRVASPEIIVFTYKKKSILVGTFTLNLHTNPEAPESDRFGYLSDLFVAEGLDDNPLFINQFFSSVFAEIVTRYPKVKVLSVMAAAGDHTIPIVKCFNHAKEAGLIYSFTRAEQERLGIVAQFILDAKNTESTHLSSFSPETLCNISANINSY